MSLLLQNISLPLTGFNLEVNIELRGLITILFGPSGSGKTSLLEVVGGLRKPQFLSSCSQPPFCLPRN